MNLFIQKDAQGKTDQSRQVGTNTRKKPRLLPLKSTGGEYYTLKGKQLKAREHQQASER